jgi:hypothetical protein
MSRNSQFNNITNEQLLLIDILNGIYNDNIRQINNYNTMITELNVNNNNIRNLLIQILNISLNNRRHNSSNSNSNSFRNSSISRNYQPLFDTVREYNIPFSQLNMLFDNNLQTNRSSVSPINTYNTSNSRSNSRSNSTSRFLESFFGPVEVYPTPSQIEAATRRVRYGDIISPLNRSCPISMDNFDDDNMVTIIRHCRHIFTSDHLNTWFRSNCRCPICRYDIRSDNSNVSSEIFQPSQQRQNISQNTSEERNNNERITTPMTLNSLLNNLFNDVNLSLDPSGNLNYN